ncbi:MAG: TrkA family potassium uptake protein [Propionibacteriales bacterium]|nr:TrkA family potassium uptake protein [Propionibacteriales bacterium]
MAEKRSEPVVVIGLGRFGSSVAQELSRRGTEVLAIDSDPKLVQSLSGELTQVVAADSTDMEALQQLGVGDFYRAVVAIGTDMEASVLTTSLLTELEIEDIWAKAVSRQHGRILERMGAHHVVFPEHDMGERIAHLVSGRVIDYIEVGKNFTMIQTHPPRELVGEPLDEALLREKYAVTLVAVKSPNEEFALPSDDAVLMYGDTLVVAGKMRDVERFIDLV